MAEIGYSWVNLDMCIATSENYEDVLKDKEYLMENDIGIVVSVYNHKFSIIQKWDAEVHIRHYMFAVENYPDLSEWELKQLISLVIYESSHGRKIAFWFGDKKTEESFLKAIYSPHEYSFVTPPEVINVCKACKRGQCITKYVCHTAGIDEAKQIFERGQILSIAKSINMTPEATAKEPINFQGDPPDYFQYVMFTWGNCFFGDRIITERKLGRIIYEEDLRNFYSPDIKFYYKFEELQDLDSAVFDGYHPIKIKDSIKLRDFFMFCVIPLEYKDSLKGCIPRDLRDKIHYVDRSTCSTIWNWADNSYSAVLEFEKK